MCHARGREINLHKRTLVRLENPESSHVGGRRDPCDLSSDLHVVLWNVYTYKLYMMDRWKGGRRGVRTDRQQTDGRTERQMNK